jgi:hypothetical protein
MAGLTEAIIEFIKTLGPSVPAEIATKLKKDSILVSAVLSDLVAQQKLIMSHLKKGKSRLYLLPNQRMMLEDFARHLNEKDYITFKLLKEKGVLRDKALEPLTRVSLRNIKDFAVPLEVNLNGSKELFWRYYLLDKKKTEEKIKEVLFLDSSPAEDNNLPEDLEKPKESINKKQEALSNHNLINKEKQKVLIEKNQKTKTGKNEIKNNDLADIKDCLKKKGIKIIEEKRIKKNDYELILELNTELTEIVAYARIKIKKNINEGDLSTAYVDGQIKKMPIILISPGKLTKKAQEKIKDLKGLKFVSIKSLSE